MATDIKALQEAAIQSLQTPGKAAKPLLKAQTQKKPTLYLFRHAQTHDNIRKIFSGRRQSTLTAVGHKQAQELAEKLKNKKIDLFISPPQKRCAQTLQPLMKYFPRVPYLKKYDLTERDYGILTGKSKMRVMRQYPQKAILWRRSWDVAPPKGESIKDVWEGRVKKFCQWLEVKMKKENINVAYCGTNNTMRLIRMYFEHLTKQQMLTAENPYDDYAAYYIK